jgi:hypothetical protein
MRFVRGLKLALIWVNQVNQDRAAIDAIFLYQYSGLTQVTLPRPDYFDGGAKFIAHCLNFDRCFARGKI